MRAILLTASLLALSGAPPAAVLAGPALQEGSAQSLTASTDCDLEGDAARFLAALRSFREGKAEALLALNGSAARLEQFCDRSDPANIAAFYASLTPDQRARGLQWEHELDALHDAAAGIPASDTGATREFRDTLAEFLRTTTGLADLPVRAHGLSLDARLAVRSLERIGLVDETTSEVATIEAAARESLALFRSAKQRTPTLEPRWTLARCALLRADWDEAELHFSELNDLALAVGRANWRERALLGLIGLTRERGSLFVVDELLEDLASFRSPTTSWALAREVAVQQIQRDQPVDALNWLETHPPSQEDEELDGDQRFAYALDEWRSLTSAAELRSGRSRRAQERLDFGSNATPSELAVLTQATIHLESGEPSRALELVTAMPSANVLAVGLIDRLTLEGRALLALGLPSEAIEPLERALELARATGAAKRVGAGAHPSEVSSGSRMGEWLGLSAIESLGRAYVERGEPLRAAVLFESIHAPTLTSAECEVEILRLSAEASCGYVTWMVGADRTLAIHVAPGGAHEALCVEVDRRGIERAVERMRHALQHASPGSADHEWQALGHELCTALLPASARRSLQLSLEGRSGKDGPTLVLSPHGALERLPFEALVLEPGEAPIGVSTALTILNSLRQDGDVAAPLQGAAADWIGLGAPSTEHYDALPGAARELESIGRMQRRWTAKTGREMTRRALESALQSGRPLHLATHVAPVKSATQGRSTSHGIAPIGFVVAGDDVVSAREVLALAPRVPLAILTACGSAEGVAVDGLSVRGMAQVMLECGTRAAIVTLWPIQDRVGELASVRIHAALLAGARPAEATRRAREFLWMLGEAPSEWAAYRLLR